MSKTKQDIPTLEPGQVFTFTGLQGIWITNLSDEEQGEYTFYNGQEHTDPVIAALAPLEADHQTGYGDAGNDARVINSGNTPLGLKFG